MKTLIMLLTLPVVLAGCGGGGPDMSPVGGGLAVIGLGIIVAAFVRSYGKRGWK